MDRSAASPSPVDYRVAEAAKAHARGWALTPLRGKIPHAKGWQKAAFPTLAQVQAWATASNVGLRTGSVSGVVVIDLEAEADPAPLGEIPPTVEVVSGGGGRHLYFKIPEGMALGNSVRRLGPKIDVRGDGGQVVYVGSIHPRTRRVYAWAPGKSPDEIPLADIPPALAVKLRKERKEEEKSEKDKAALESILGQAGMSVMFGTTAYGKAALDGLAKEVGSTEEGSRNDRLVRAAFRIGQLISGGEVEEKEAWGALMAAGLDCGLPYKEVDSVVERGIKAGKEHPRSAPSLGPVTGNVEVQDEKTPESEPTPSVAPPDDSGAVDGGSAKKARKPAVDPTIPSILRTTNDGATLNDMGNAYRLKMAWQGEILFVDGIGWHTYDGARWVPGDAGVRERAKETARRIYTEAAQEKDRDKAIDLARFAVLSGQWRRLDGCLRVAESVPELRRAAEDFDSDPLLLTTKSGTIDLRTGTIRPNSREDYARRCSPVVYDPAATCPTFLRFIERILPSEEVRAYVQRFLGYCLTASVKEHAFAVWYGDGGNGKSTLIEVVGDVMGEYAQPASFATFTTDRNPSSASSDLAVLVGSRMVSAVESSENAAFNAEFLKRITGGDRVSARHLYKAEFGFRPTFKILLATNHKPKVSDPTNSIWRRLHLVPFTVSIPKAEQDRDLPDKLRVEASGVLNWILAGCLEWQRIGLEPPEAVRVATQEYREGEDIVRRFVDEKCVTGDPASFRALSGSLYSAYVKWAKSSGEDGMSARAFGERIKGMGFAEHRTSGKRWRTGIALQQDDEDDDKGRYYDREGS